MKGVPRAVKLTGVCAVTLPASGALAPPLSVAPTVDFARYGGRWCETAIESLQPDLKLVYK